MKQFCKSRAKRNKEKRLGVRTRLEGYDLLVPHVVHVAKRSLNERDVQTPPYSDDEDDIIYHVESIKISDSIAEMAGPVFRW